MAQGIVTKATGNIYSVRSNNGIIYECHIKGKLRISGFKSTNPVVVGDNVEFELNENLKIGIIQEVIERRNYIIRKSINLSKQYQIIAANIDQAFLVVTLIEPETQTDFIDRFLVSAEAFRIPVILIFNKIDLYKNEIFEKFVYLKEQYEGIGYKCVDTSTVSLLNIDVLREMMKNKLSVFNGNSGVGKSSLIKCLDPNIDIKIGKISDFHKSGKHTTSYSEMIKLESGGFIIDTPGIRGFGLIDFGKEELYHFFPEIFKFSANCKFYNCTHIHEPGCAVIIALDEGKISNFRYESYFNLFHDGNEKYRI